MKQGKIYLYDQYVGLLTEDETGFTFAYDADYLGSSQAEAVECRSSLPAARIVSEPSALSLLKNLMQKVMRIANPQSHLRIKPTIHPKTRKEK